MHFLVGVIQRRNMRSLGVERKWMFLINTSLSSWRMMRNWLKSNRCVWCVVCSVKLEDVGDIVFMLTVKPLY